MKRRNILAFLEWSLGELLGVRMRFGSGAGLDSPFMPRMQGGPSTSPPATPRKSVELAPPSAAYWRQNSKCGGGRGGKGTGSATAGARRDSLAQSPRRLASQPVGPDLWWT